VDWIESKAAATIDPGRVRVALIALKAAWRHDLPPLRDLIERFPVGEKSLLALFAVSPVSAEKLAHDPAGLVWLAQPEICASDRGPRRMRVDLELEKAPGFDPHFRALRRIKARELVRIALRDIARLSTLEQTTLELSHLAELCLHEVYTGWLAEFSRRWGAPKTDFTVLGMGKFGGQELNYSSDIDVIFLFGEDGMLNPNFSHQDFFTRLAEKIVATFSSADAGGALFRIDLRLRPEGASGPLVRSLESMENYYAGFGETWERMALIKACRVCGSEELAYEFSQHLQPFIFPRTLSSDLVDEISAIKARIERELVGHENLRRNVKLGYGGIREIEFVVQTLQLIHGARHAFLQERNTLRALRALQELNLVQRHDMETLASAYRFLRDVEHRLQIEHEQQTHTLPEQHDARTHIAAGLGFASLTTFEETLRAHTDGVRAIFDKVLRANRDSAEIAASDLSFFNDAPRAEKELAQLRRAGAGVHIAPRTGKLFAKLEPLLLAQLSRVADPDLALTRFVRYVERYGIRGTLFEMLVTHPRLLELLVRLFDASRFLTDIVLRRPQLIEELTRGDTLGKSYAVADYLAGLAQNEERLGWMDGVRVYRRAQILRIALRDILGFADLERVQSEYSALAEACVIFVQRELGLDDSLTAVAMGKFGGCELSYGCDLDVIFLGENVAGTAELIKAITARTNEGIVFPLDARLRPEGVAGLLTIPLDSYEAYFQNRAQLWEAQALTKSRPISGPLQNEFARWSRQTWRRFGACDDLFEKIRAMHARIVRERSSSQDLLEFKTGSGGLMELEFLTQALQMRHNVWEPNTPRALTLLGERSILPLETARELTAHYFFLRKIEAVIRRVENSSASTLPSSEFDQLILARRLGFAKAEEFFDSYRGARDSIHLAFELVLIR